MDFLSKHYEKLILMGMLLFFIFAMISVRSIASQTGQVDEKALRIPTRAADYEPQKQGDAKFKPENVWRSGAFSWKKASHRDKDKKMLFYSDMTEFPGLAVCFVGKDDSGKESGCGNLIPRVYFSEKPCPNCGRILKTPPKRPKFRRNVITANDSDGDGISNNDEQKYKLDPYNPYDALYDLDGDGFSNIFEVDQNTDPTIARQHPPHWYRLRLVDVRRVELPISFRVLNTYQQKDPKRWDFQLNFKIIRYGRVSDKTEMKRLGEAIQIEKRRYIIKRVERIINDSSGSSKKKEELVAGGKMEATQDKAQDLSKIFLEEELKPEQIKNGEKPDKLEMQIGKPVYSSDRRPIFEDVGLPEGKRQKHVCRVGQKFRIGSARTGGYTEYILHSFDEKKMTAKLELARVGGKQDAAMDERGEEMIVTREGKIPEDSRVIEVIVTAGSNENVGENVQKPRSGRQPRSRGQRRRR